MDPGVVRADPPPRGRLVLGGLNAGPIAGLILSRCRWLTYTFNTIFFQGRHPLLIRAEIEIIALCIRDRSENGRNICPEHIINQ